LQFRSILYPCNPGDPWLIPSSGVRLFHHPGNAGQDARRTGRLEACPTVAGNAPPLAANQPVAQVSKPAVSPISQSAGLPDARGQRVWTPTQLSGEQPATQQTWKSALRWQCHAPGGATTGHGQLDAPQSCAILAPTKGF
jgi:hypothetical protein